MASAQGTPAADVAARLARAPLLVRLDAGARERLAADGERVALRSGELLYEAGEPATDVYVVLGGRLRVTAGETVLGYVGAGQPVGEMGVVVGEPRSATVHAVRDSELLRVANSDFLALMHDHPDTLLELSRLVIGRLREQGRTRLLAATEARGTLAVVPASADVPAMEFAQALVRRLSGWPAVRLIGARHVDAALGEGSAQTPLDDAAASAPLTSWLGELESRHAYVVYTADGQDSQWALRCLHNADRVLVLGEAAAPPERVPVLDELRRSGAPVELVLLRPDGDPSPHTLDWRERTGARAHYFLHPWDERGLDSLARQLTGRGVGLVLGGGGARGFAHIGLVRACERLGIPIDAAGGTSMGAFIGALVACGFDSLEMTHIARETFVRNSYLNDYALPRVSLIRGRKFAARLAEIFGELRIEDLRTTYFCVSANLTTGEPVVHDRGPLHTWVGTSMAIPGVAPPIAYDGELLCDGGVLDNLPTDFMQKLERGSIIASNVSSEGDISAPGAGMGEPDPEALLRRHRGEALPRIGSILMRTATVTSSAAMELAARRADVYLRMPSQDYGLFDWRALDELVELGYEHALAQLEPLRSQLVRQPGAGAAANASAMPASEA